MEFLIFQQQASQSLKQQLQHEKVAVFKRNFKEKDFKVNDVNNFHKFQNSWPKLAPSSQEDLQHRGSSRRQFCANSKKRVNKLTLPRLHSQKAQSQFKN